MTSTKSPKGTKATKRTKPAKLAEPTKVRIADKKVVDELLLEFMAYLRLRKHRTDLTVDAYTRDLHEFGAWLQGVPTNESPMGRMYPESPYGNAVRYHPVHHVP